MHAIRAFWACPLRFSLTLAVSLSLSLNLAPSPAAAAEAAISSQAVPQDQILRPEDHPGISFQFGGMSMATSGDWLALGGGSDDRTPLWSEWGNVLLWKRVDGRWEPRQVLSAAVPRVSASHPFGMNIVMDGKRLVVGSGTGTESLHTFVLKGDTWVFDGILSPKADDITSGSFGIENSIAISGDLVAVGTRGGRVGGLDGVGWVDVFQRTSTGWVRQARLTDPPPPGTEASPASISFGHCVGLQRDMLFVSMYHDSLPLPRISIYKKTGAAWVRQPGAITGPHAFFPQKLTASPAGDRLFIHQSGRMAEYSLTRPYQLISQLARPGFGHVRGKSLIWFTGGFPGSDSVSLQHQLPDRTWVVDRELGAADTGLARVTHVHHTGRELLIAGNTAVLDAPINSFQIRSIPQVTPVLEFDHSGNVTEGPPTVPPSEKTDLLAGEHLVGKEVKSLVTINAYLPSFTEAAGLDTAPVNVYIGLTRDEEEFSISSYQLTVQPGKKTPLTVNFKPRTPGTKRLYITFSRLDDPTFLVRYEIIAQAVEAATPVQITQPPQSGLYSTYEFPGLHVRATGTQPLTYRWLRDGAPVPGGTGPSLWPEKGGTYTVEVSNPAGVKVTSAPAALGFYATQQSLVIVPPGSPARCALALSGPGITVRWASFYGPLQDGPLYSGTATPVLTARGVDGSETFSARVTMSTPQGGQLTADLFTTVYAVAPPQIQDIYGERTYRVGDILQGEQPVVDYAGPGYGYPRFTYSSLPPGIYQEENYIAGTFTTPGVYTFHATVRVDTFTARKSFKFTVLPNGPPPGIYWGYVNRTSSDQVPGSILLDVTPTGAYTGTLWTGTLRTPLAGFLSGLPGFSSPERPLPVKLDGVSQVYWLRSTQDPLSFDLRVRDASLPPDSTGSNSSVYASVHLIRTRELNLEAASTGRFNFGLMADRSDGELEGHGFGTLNIHPSGRAVCVGQLPDGTGITGTAWLDTGTNIYFYFADPSSGSLLHQEDARSGNWFWRPPAKGRLHLGGYKIDRALTFTPSRYRAQPGQPLLEGGQHQLRITIPGVYRIEPTSFTFTSAHTARLGPGLENPHQARLDVYAPTGFFSGRFTLRDEDPANPARTILRTVQYRGMLLQEQNQGVGCFLIPGLPDPSAQPPTTLKTSPIYSGAIEIEP